MYKQGREHASFLALIFDQTTKGYAPPTMATNIRCNNKKCAGTIEVGIDLETDKIEWWCTHCDETGKISGWQKTKWVNRS